MRRNEAVNIELLPKMKRTFRLHVPLNTSRQNWIKPRHSMTIRAVFISFLQPIFSNLRCCYLHFSVASSANRLIVANVLQRGEMVLCHFGRH